MRWIGLALALALSGCGNKTDETKAGAPEKVPASAASAAPAPKIDLPGTEAGAKALLTRFLDPAADHAALSKALRPTAEDYAAIYPGEFAQTLEKMYAPAWDAGALVLAPKAGQTELLLWSATGADLKAGQGNASKFPGGYAKVADKLADEVTLYRFKFARPGETLGMAFDGLAHVNGRWVIVPKPWRAMP